MPILFKKYVKLVAMFDDVVEVYGGSPYRSIRHLGLQPHEVQTAKRRGYFEELQSLRMWYFTNRRLILTPIHKAEKIINERKEAHAERSGLQDWGAEEDESLG